MGRTRKQIDETNVELVRDYFRRKMATDEVGSLLVADAKLGIKALEKVLANGTLNQWNDWADKYLSELGRKTLWGALRGRSYRKDNPRNELNKSVADQVRAITKEDDINAAVLALIQAHLRKRK